MPEIHQGNGLVTQITTIQVDPDKQDEVLQLMSERAHYMAQQPGFISISLHRSQDGNHVVNYVQWSDRQKLEAAHHSPEFRMRSPLLVQMADEFDPCLYEVVLVEGK